MMIDERNIEENDGHNENTLKCECFDVQQVYKLV